MAAIFTSLVFALALFSIVAAYQPYVRVGDFLDCSNVTMRGGGVVDSSRCTYGSHAYPNNAQWDFTFISDLEVRCLPTVNVQYDVDIESEMFCSWDRLTLGASSSNPVPICGKQRGKFSVFDPVSPGLYRIRFTSDSSVTERGFRLTVTFSCAPEFNTTDLPRFNGVNPVDYWVDYIENFDNPSSDSLYPSPSYYPSSSYDASIFVPAWSYYNSDYYPSSSYEASIYSPPSYDDDRVHFNWYG